MKRILLVFLFAVGLSFGAFTERYVTVTGAGAHDGLAEASAWTFAEMIAAAPGTGVRVNMKVGAYSEGVTTIPSGTAAAWFVIRGYNATIGDLDNQGRNADTTLNTTNFPDVTITGLWTPGTFMVLQNLDITGALASSLVGSGAVDVYTITSCRIVNTSNNAAAKAVLGDDNVSYINSDLSCTGAAHGFVLDADSTISILGCRFTGVDADPLVSVESTRCFNSAFVGSNVNIGAQVLSGSLRTMFGGNTFYNLTTSVQLPNAVNTLTYWFFNNICTDSDEWINSLYSGTATVSIFEANTRIRDVATPRTGVEAVLFGEVTTDTGGAETDYVDAAGGNLRLISTSPALAVGMTPYMDIGAYQREASASGGGPTGFSF